MIIIFLDIDGVLLHPQYHDHGKDRVNLFDAYALTYLQELIVYLAQQLKKSVGIVISSDWRHYSTVNELQQRFEQYSFARHIIGKTSEREDLQELDYTRGSAFKSGLLRIVLGELTILLFLMTVSLIYNDISLTKDRFVHCTEGVLSCANLKSAISILTNQKPKQLFIEKKCGDSVCESNSYFCCGKASSIVTVKTLIAKHPEKLLTRESDCCETLHAWVSKQDPFILMAELMHQSLLKT